MNRCSCFCSIIFAVFIYLQYPVHAQLAPGVDWKRVKSTHFDIVAASEHVEKAQAVANMLEYLYKEYGPTLHTSMQRWTIKINPEVALFNGFVMSSPRYSEFYLPQPNSLFPNAYYDDDGLYSLSTHEVRHMAQFDKDMSGFNRIWYILGGDRMIDGMRYLNGMPNWFYEGDATLFETEYSTAGRGRIPAFSLLTKARLLDGKPLGYYQALHYSYVKQEAGDPYIMGYNIISTVRSKYGADVFGTIGDKKNDFLGILPLGFRTAVRRTVHTSILSLYRESLDAIGAKYRRQVDGLDITAARRLFEPGKNDFVSLADPQWADTQTLVYYVNSREKPGRIETITLSGRRSVVTKRLRMLPSFHLHESTILYTVPWGHARFENSFSDIYRCDIVSKKICRISRKARYYSPVMDATGNRIALLALDSAGKTGIRIIDAKTGAVLQAIKLPDLIVPSNPTWDAESKCVVYIVNGSRGYGIAKWNPDSASAVMVLDYQKDMLTGLEPYRKWLLYTSPCSGIDNIHALDTRSGKRYQVSSRKYSASFPRVSPDGKRIAFIDFGGPSGDAPAVMPFDTTAWILRDSIDVRAVRLYDIATDSAPRFSIAQFAAVKRDTFPADDYPVIKHLFNVHSWQLLANPFFFVDGTSLLGLNLSSNSIFRDVGWRLDAGYEPGGDNASVGPLFTFNGWWPQFLFGESYSRNTIFDKSRPYTSSLDGLAGVNLPLNFYFNRSSLSITTGFDALPSVEMERSGTAIAGSGRLITDYSAEGGLYFEAPATNINGYYGITGNAVFSNNYRLDGSADISRKLYVSVNASLPAFLGRDNFNICVRYFGGNDSAGMSISSRSFAPREIDSVEQAEKRTTGSLSYSVPLFHPDFALGPVLYFTRIGITLFGDASINLEKVNYNKQAWSTGVELFTDFEVFTIPLPVRLGARAAYTQSESNLDDTRINWFLTTPFPAITAGKGRSSMHRSAMTGWRRTEDFPPYL